MEKNRATKDEIEADLTSLILLVRRLLEEADEASFEAKNKLRNLKILRAFIFERKTKEQIAQDFNLGVNTVKVYKKKAIDLIWSYASENLRDFILQTLSSARSGVL